MTRYLPARHYGSFGVVALGLCALSVWVGLGWTPAFIPAVLFLATAALLFWMTLQPPIEVRETALVLGKTSIGWSDIRRVDRTAWLSPLVIRLTLYDDSRLLLIYPGDLDQCKSLLRQVHRLCRDAMIDGIPYRQFWGEVLSASSERKQSAPPRYRLLRPEDESEVERLYQKLKAMRHADPDQSLED